MTRPTSFEKKSSLYVWGSNSHSEIGLTEEQVAANKQHYHKTLSTAYLSKPIQYKSGFDNMVSTVACGCISSIVVGMDQGE
jgi:alpha-tubulin suppressor-like RCC1 family protein